MTPTVGFIILTHNKPHQTIKLFNTLNHMFNYPPIVCHHDFSKSELPTDTLSKNIVLVQPYLQTGWGGFSLVDAMLTALKLMYEAPNPPDWFVLLSGADYPIKPAQQILQDLASSPYDVHITYEQINYNAFEHDWQKLCYERYCAVKFRVPFLNKKLHLIRREIHLVNQVVALKYPLLTAPFLPFSKNLRCFAGEHWFCANRKAANYLIEFHREKPALASHYRRLEDFGSSIPDESYYHTILCNAPHLTISKNHWRYVDWSTKGAHPKTLFLEDLPKIYASSAHFARKFDIDQDVRILNELDAIVR
jgi:hypothetical protein